MFELLQIVVRWVARKCLLLLLVLVVLWGALWLRGQYQDWRQQEQALLTHRQRLPDLQEQDRQAQEELRRAQQRERQRASQVGWWQKGTYTLSEESQRKVNGLAQSRAELMRYQAQARLACEAYQQQQRALAELERARQEDFRYLLLTQLLDLLPQALAIVGLLILTPVLLRVALYYLLAPLARFLKPVQILPRETPSAALVLSPSAISQRLDVRADQELLIQPDYLQSSEQRARKKTRLLLRPSLPFTSLASGLYLLTSVRPPREAESSEVVISTKREALQEVACLELDSETCVVVQPRSLIGVLQCREEPLHITRHWRLGSLHAWLTLQLRYLVFHGPGTLLVRGCRGVRAEEAGRGGGRLLNQEALIAFSADLPFQNTRCETFFSYLRGKEDLFNALFSGLGGSFVYEEVPSESRRGSLVGRGLEGLLDGLLKVFGI